MLLIRGITIIICLLTTMFFSCNEKQISNKIQNTKVDSLSENHKPETQTEEQFDYSTMKFDKIVFPKLYEKYQTILCLKGMLHQESAELSYAQKKWIGLFRNGAKYWVEKTKVSTSSFYDPIVDNKGEKSGVEINIPQEDTCYLLIHNAPSIQNGNVEHIPELKNKKLYPGDSFFLTTMETSI